MSKDRLLSDEATRNELIKLKDSDGKYILNTIGASNPVAMRALIDFINTQKRLYAEMIIDTDTDVDISEALKKIYSDGYSKGYNDRTYENSYNSVDFRMAEAIASAVAKVRSRYDKQLKELEDK